MAYKVAVVGATGNVGREILKILAERNFPISDVVALASNGSEGKDISTLVRGLLGTKSPITL